MQSACQSSRLALSLLALAPSALAQVQKAESAGETVVTARKTEEKELDVPGSMTVLGEEELRSAGVESVREAALRVPNVNITEFSSRRLSFPYVRGIGSGQGEPAVTTYVDGVPQLTVGSTNLPLLDVERIEFLRGPQGTLYGRNALGGLIHIVTAPPGRTANNAMELSFGQYGYELYRISTSGPLDYDHLAYGFGFQYQRREGFTKNIPSGNDIDGRDAYFAKGDLLYTPDEDTQIRFSMHGERARDGGFALGFLGALRDRPNRVSEDFEGKTERDLFAPSLTWREARDGYDFVSITAFEDWNVSETSDFDFSTLDGVRRRSEEDQEYLYQEARISSTEQAVPREGEGWQWSWLAGVSAFAADSSRLAQNDLRDGGVGILFDVPGLDTSDGSFDDYGLALFGRAGVRSEELEFSLGLRLDYEDKSADLQHTFETGGFTVLDDENSLDESYTKLVPQASAAWHYGEHGQTYLSIAQGFKAGGFNLTGPEDNLAFDTEKSTTFELGLKQLFPTLGLEIGLAVFQIDWSDMQLSLFDATNGGYVDNAGESTSQGIELEVAAEPVDDLLLSLGLGWIDTEFDKYTDAYGSDVSGNSLTFAPETTLSLGAQYSWEARRGLVPFVRADWMDVGKFYYDPQNLESESYQLLDLRAGLESEGSTFSIWAKNALDEEYVPVAFQASPADPSVFVGESGMPRMYGFTLRFTF